MKLSFYDVALVIKKISDLTVIYGHSKNEDIGIEILVSKCSSKAAWGRIIGDRLPCAHLT